MAFLEKMYFKLCLIYSMFSEENNKGKFYWFLFGLPNQWIEFENSFNYFEFLISLYFLTYYSNFLWNKISFDWFITSFKVSVNYLELPKMFGGTLSRGVGEKVSSNIFLNSVSRVSICTCFNVNAAFFLQEPDQPGESTIAYK